MGYVIKPHRDGDGHIIEGVAGEDLNKYDLVHLTARKWYKADRNSSPTLPAFGMVLSNLPIDYKGRILLYGLVGNLDWNWEDGAIYASTIIGGLTQEPPDWSGWVQSIGVAHGSDYMLFAPMWLKNLDVSPVMTIAQEGEYKVMTIYVEHIEGKPKLRVEYDLPE